MASPHLRNIIEEYRSEWLRSVKTHSVPGSNLKGTAYHEAGHVVAALAQDTTTFSEVTIIPNQTNNSLGDTNGQKKENVTLEKIVVTDFAGPISEAMVGEVYSTGIGKDWRHALSQINYILEDKGVLSSAVENDRSAYEALFRPLYEELLSLAKEMINNYKASVILIAEELCKKSD